MSHPPARSRRRRIRDTLALLEGGTDCWVATSAPDGRPHLVPLSFGWEGGVVSLATPASYRTAVNLLADPRVRLAFGTSRDVVVMDGTARVRGVEEVPGEAVDGFARQAGFDPRRHEGYAFIEVTPERVLAWRAENELEGRVLMRGGAWADGEE